MEDSEPNVEPEQGVKKEAEEEESERVGRAAQWLYFQQCMTFILL